MGLGRSWLTTVRLLQTSMVMVLRICSLPLTIWPTVFLRVVPAVMSDLRLPLMETVTLEPL